MLNIQIKNFQELTTQELYNILQLRSEVFVVEQNSIYQDIDGKDQKALHILGFKNEKVAAYTRIFKAGDYFEIASIGRVVVAKKERQFNYGNIIMNASIDAVKNIFNENSIKISAQTYLTRFYTNLGFKAVGEGYLEDGIPHLTMVKES